jgi:DNA-directed RNA polymerase subunit RPC12/RpoP
MKKRLVRCFVGFGTTGGRSNIEVFYVVPEMYAKALYTCLECGEVFVADLENPAFAGRESAEVVKGTRCPSCNADLNQTISCYPQTFRAPDGSLGSFDPGTIIPPDNESLVREFFEIVPS